MFLLDLLSIPLPDVSELLRDLFVSPHVLKLGFRFKQDLAYLSSTFSNKGCPGFDRVEPFLDITSIYYRLKDQKDGKKLPKDTKSLASICKEMLDITLSKELQCSDWSCRPLTEEQLLYAAADAYYLLQIFSVFECKFLTEGKWVSNLELNMSSAVVGLKEILEESIICDNIVKFKFCKASDMVNSSVFKVNTLERTIKTSNPWISSNSVLPMDESVSNIVRIFGERILLKDTDKKPRASRRKGRRSMSLNAKRKEKFQNDGDWQELPGTPPWDPSFGGDGCPKFLCDVMVEGLARHLRCVGIDAATPSSRKPEPRQLLDKAKKEKRVVLTRDAKLLKHQYMGNQVYRVKSLLKNDQLLEVIEAFGLKICEEELLSRCSKCNGSFNPVPLKYDEATLRGAQVIPECLVDKKFWQCTNCNQLYWEGTKYQNAIQKFATVCKLND